MFVARSTHRWLSIARIRTMFRCCHGALVSPYHPSFEIFTSTSAPILRELPDLIAKDRLVADKRSIGMPAVGRTLRASPLAQTSPPRQQVSRKEEELLDTAHTRRTAPGASCRTDPQTVPIRQDEQTRPSYAGVDPAFGPGAPWRLVNADIAHNHRRPCIRLPAPAFRSPPETPVRPPLNGAGDSGHTTRSVGVIGPRATLPVCSSTAGRPLQLRITRAPGVSGIPRNKVRRRSPAQCGKLPPASARLGLRGLHLGCAHLQVLLHQRRVSRPPPTTRSPRAPAYNNARDDDRHHQHVPRPAQQGRVHRRSRTLIRTSHRAFTPQSQTTGRTRPAQGAICRQHGLSTCVNPSRSHGNPVIRAIAPAPPPPTAPEPAAEPLPPAAASSSRSPSSAPNKAWYSPRYRQKSSQDPRRDRLSQPAVDVHRLVDPVAAAQVPRMNPQRRTRASPPRAC